MIDVLIVVSVVSAFAVCTVLAMPWFAWLCGKYFEWVEKKTRR